MKKIEKSYLTKIQEQLSNIQLEVKELHTKNELELLKDEFGGELFNNNTVLKIGKFCSIEYLGGMFKLSSIIYGMRQEKICNKDTIIEILRTNI